MFNKLLEQLNSLLDQLKSLLQKKKETDEIGVPSKVGPCPAGPSSEPNSPYVDEETALEIIRTGMEESETNARNSMLSGTGHRDIKLLNNKLRTKIEKFMQECEKEGIDVFPTCLLYTSPSPRDRQKSRMPSSA